MPTTLKEAKTERTPQEELEEIFTALDNLVGRRDEKQFNFDSPENAGVRFVIRRNGIPELDLIDQNTFKVIFNPTGRQHLRLEFRFTRGTGVTEVEIGYTKLTVENEGKRLGLAGTMLRQIRERTSPKTE